MQISGIANMQYANELIVEHQKVKLIYCLQLYSGIKSKYLLYFILHSKEYK